MTQTAFTVDCGSGDTRYRVRFVTEKGTIQEFLVQLEFRIGDEWRPVIRYDTAHGYAHCDRYEPDGTVTPHQALAFPDYNQALTFVLGEVKNRWTELIRPFQESSP